MSADFPDSGSAPTAPAAPRVRCVGAAIWDRSGRLLMILRGHEPGKGLWSIPGGRIEPGESDEDAVVREVLEETGLSVTCGRLLGSVELPWRADAIADIKDYVAELLPDPDCERADPRPVAGDDAAAVRWVAEEEASDMDARGEITPGLLAALRSWI